MRTLNAQEMDAASGGLIPLAVVGFALAVASKVTAGGTATGWAVSSAGLIVGSYGLAAHFLGPKLNPAAAGGCGNGPGGG